MDTDTLAARASSPTPHSISAPVATFSRPRAVSNVPASQSAAGAFISMPTTPSHPIRSCVPAIILLWLCALLVVVAAISSGCSTTGGSGTGPGSEKLNPARVQAIAKLATYVGVTADLQQSPQHRTGYERASVALQVLVDQERWDTTAVATALMAAGVTEFQGSEGALYLTGGLMLMDAFAVGQYDVRDKAHAEAVVLGVNEGLKLALGNPAFVARTRSGPGDIRPDPWLAQLSAEAVATRRLH